MSVRRSEILTYRVEVSTTALPTRMRSTGIPQDPATVVFVFSQLLPPSIRNSDLFQRSKVTAHKLPW